MKSRHPPTQFDVKERLRRRPLERLMIGNHLLGQIIHILGVSGLTGMIWPRFIAPFRWRLARYPMAIDVLPAEFEGYKILHVSDLHAGRTRVEYLRRVLRAALAHKPDLIVVTGDFIQYCPEGLEDLPAILAELHAPDGVLGIFGNHDYHEYSWRHIGERSAHRAIHKRLVKMLLAANVRLLRNDCVKLNRGGTDLHIVGMDELWVGHCDPAKAFAGVPRDGAIVCLQHNPDGYEYLKEYPWQWLLCGHTHGGQVDLPLLGPLYVPSVNRQWLRGFFAFPDSPGRPGTSGHRGSRPRHMFVTTGIGYSTPIRLRVPPEVVLFTLTRAMATLERLPHVRDGAALAAPVRTQSN